MVKKILHLGTVWRPTCLSQLKSCFLSPFSECGKIAWFHGEFKAGLFFLLILTWGPAQGAVRKKIPISPTHPLSFLKEKRAQRLKALVSNNEETLFWGEKKFAPPIFDFPMTYNDLVSRWIKYFQTRGKRTFQKWLERSSRFEPYIKNELKKHKIPQDLFYVAMIESGLSNRAKSSAGAVGLWQFIEPTAQRYGLNVNWWLDERKDFTKATGAAISYKKDLFRMFGSWHLVSASYNVGENRVARLVRKYGVKDFWKLAKMKVLPKETINYVPKIIAATLISKSPGLYGFRNLQYKLPYRFQKTTVPGGTDLNNLARYIGVRKKYLRELNPDLVRGFIPRKAGARPIKIPIGSKNQVEKYAKLLLQTPKESSPTK